VARPNLVAVTILVPVYVPVLALDGVAGKMFRPLALTVILALSSELLLTIPVMPELAAIALSGSGIGEHETPLVRWLRRLYLPILEAAERRTGVTVLLAAAVCSPRAWVANFCRNYPRARSSSHRKNCQGSTSMPPSTS
jgi:cobalt-zinc-cadmium resistance protein CzcA